MFLDYKNISIVGCLSFTTLFSLLGMDHAHERWPSEGDRHSTTTKKRLIGFNIVSREQNIHDHHVRVSLLRYAMQDARHADVLELLRKDQDLKDQLRLISKYSQCLLSSRESGAIEHFLNFIEQPGVFSIPYLLTLAKQLVQAHSVDRGFQNYGRHMGILLARIDDTCNGAGWMYYTNIFWHAIIRGDIQVIGLLKDYKVDLEFLIKAHYKRICRERIMDPRQDPFIRRLFVLHPMSATLKQELLSQAVKCKMSYNYIRFFLDMDIDPYTVHNTSAEHVIDTIVRTDQVHYLHCILDHRPPSEQQLHMLYEKLAHCPTAVECRKLIGMPGSDSDQLPVQPEDIQQQLHGSTSSTSQILSVLGNGCALS